MNKVHAWWMRNAASAEVILFLLIVTGLALLALMVLCLPLALPV